MNREGHDEVSFFIGTEVEHTPAFGKRTLFVVGLQDPQIVLQEYQNNDCDHIYFGANQSFTEYEWINLVDWVYMIRFCLEKIPNYCTFDFDVRYAKDVVDTALVEFNNFIPMISVKLPHIAQLGYNATIKLDDKDFAATNPGVWCHSLHDLQKREVFTDWSKYTQDEVIQ